MIIELSKISHKSTIELFAEEIYRNHIAYCGDKELAYSKSKEILTGIKEHGLEICNIPPWGVRLKEPQYESLSNLSKKYSHINIEYVWKFFGSELRWILY